MTMTDPIADMLARLRNANSAYHEKVSMPSSSVKARIAEILKQEGYISGFYIESNPTGFGKTVFASAKWHMLESYQVSPRLLGNTKPNYQLRSRSA